MLFPEGTSTNGDTVKEFRTSLFETAVLAKCPILPICIKYKTIDGKEISPENRDLLYWYGDMEFAPHFMKLLGRRIEVEIDVLECLLYSEDKTRQQFSESVYGQICTCFHKS
jgi:1-acyl-sn-glycerol-3-phosphate acyltransferase